MPVPIAMGGTLGKVSGHLAHLAQSVGHISKKDGHAPKSDLDAIANHLQAACATLDKANGAGGLSQQDYSDMADAFQGIADELRKGA